MQGVLPLRRRHDVVHSQFFPCIGETASVSTAWPIDNLSYLALLLQTQLASEHLPYTVPPPRPNLLVVVDLLLDPLLPRLGEHQSVREWLRDSVQDAALLYAKELLN